MRLPSRLVNSISNLKFSVLRRKNLEFCFLKQPVKSCMSFSTCSEWKLLSAF